jgi:branched-chain amino acid transport system substrate-binding protein
MLRIRFLLLIAVFALVAAACSSDDSGDDTSTTSAETTVAAAETTTTAAATTTVAAATTTAAGGGGGGPIVIGAAVDLTNDMSFFDGPALAAAQIQVDAINAEGGVMGRQLELRVIDTELDEAQTQAAAIDLIDGGAEILLVTCDVDFATPAITEGINAGLLTVSPCIGTDQMGPNRFGEAGRLAFSLGNMAQDEGAAMAEFAFDSGKTKAAIVRDNLLVYFQDVVDAFKVRFEELGGEIVAEENFTSFDGTIGSVVTAIDGTDADVIAVSSAFADLPATFSQQLRALGNDTTIICSWGCDGNFWVPEGLSDFYYVTFASAFEDDPVPAVNEMAEGVAAATGTPPLTGGFVTGASTIDAIVAAIEETGGTDGAALAAAFEGFDAQPTLSGPISFSEEFHTVFGRPYRVIKITDGVNAYDSDWQATSPAKIR